MQVTIDDLIIDPAAVTAYSPPGHTGTANRRLVGREQGASWVELVLGEILPGGEAAPHSHPHNEQVVYMFSGQGRITALGETRMVRGGQALFLPAGVKHSVVAVGSEPMRILVIYAPPLQSQAPTQQQHEES